MAHPDATAAMLGGRGEVVANFSSSPFQYRQLKNPASAACSRARICSTGRLSFNVIATTAKFRAQNPKLYEAFLAALKEATDFINEDKRRAAEVYLKMAATRRRTRTSWRSSPTRRSLHDQAVGHRTTSSSFMAKTGSLRNPPKDWRAEMLLPEAK